MSFRNTILISLILAAALVIYFFDVINTANFLSINALTEQQKADQSELARFKQRESMIASSSNEQNALLWPTIETESMIDESESSRALLDENLKCRRNYRGKKLDYQGLLGQRYQLDVQAAKSLNDLQFEFESRLDDVFDQYLTWLSLEGDALLPVVPIIIFFIRDPENFRQLLAHRGVDPINIQGVYFPRRQRSLVKVNTMEQAIDTAIHEAVHAINDIYFDRMPRFINEGIAEFFENNKMLESQLLETNKRLENSSLEQEPEYSANNELNAKRASNFQLPSWIDLSAPYDELLDFYTLLYSESDWHTSNNRSLYFSGNIWFRFLLSSEQGQVVLAQILQTKFKAPCEPLMAEDIGDMFSELYPLFEQDFNYWYEQQVEYTRSLKTEE